jgi:hypothetical protein
MSLKKRWMKRTMNENFIEQAGKRAAINCNCSVCAPCGCAATPPEVCAALVVDNTYILDNDSATKRAAINYFCSSVCADGAAASDVLSHSSAFHAGLPCINNNATIPQSNVVDEDEEGSVVDVNVREVHNKYCPKKRKTKRGVRGKGGRRGGRIGGRGMCTDDSKIPRWSITCHNNKKGIFQMGSFVNNGVIYVDNALSLDTQNKIGIMLGNLMLISALKKQHKYPTSTPAGTGSVNMGLVSQAALIGGTTCHLNTNVVKTKAIMDKVTQLVFPIILKLFDCLFPGWDISFGTLYRNMAPEVPHMYYLLRPFFTMDFNTITIIVVLFTMIPMTFVGYLL